MHLKMSKNPTYLIELTFKISYKFLFFRRQLKENNLLQLISHLVTHKLSSGSENMS